MEYREFEPAPGLRGRVRYWRLTGPGDGAQAEPVLPDGCVELIVHLGDPFERECEGRRERQPRVLFVGPATAPVRLAPGGRIDVIGVRLEAGLAAQLLDVEPATLVDQIPALAEVAPELARGLGEELDGPRAGESWTAALDRRLVPLLADAPRAAERVLDAAVAHVRARAGRVSVAELARAANLSTRQLERRFRARVGLGPKTFARLVRFQRALALLRTRGTRLAEVAARAGYYDQAHLVRDFQQFAGASPTRYLAGGHELAAHFVDAAP